MIQEEVPRNLPERTGRHLCINCLAETPPEEYFRNDHICDACAAKLDPPDAGDAAEETESG